MRFHVLAMSLSLGLLAAMLPLDAANAARSDTRNGQSAMRQSALGTSALRPVSVRGGYSALPGARAGTPRQSRAQAGRRGTSSYSFGGGISCVPYARSVTGMAISGNGRDWWHNAAGRYARSSRPEAGAILSFPGSGAMRSGHVAVVSRVVNARLIEIDHANWGGPGIRRGSVMHGVDVIDVSPANDWTQVRVQVGHSNDQFGREYPTHGFILNRPDNGGTGTALAGYSGGYSRVSYSRGARSARPALLHRASFQPARQSRR
jgi:surface antigen